MKFTLNWLKDYLETDATVSQICETLTSIGLEVESVEDFSKTLSSFKVAEIISAEKHPNADKLRVCQVNDGEKTLQIVCGAANARAGIKVVLAPVGTFIPGSGITIKQSNIRNVESNGMLCSAEELNLPDSTDGIIELPQTYNVGESFIKAHGLNDSVIEIAITPNRGDCLGVYGVARDLSAAGLGKLKKLEVPANKTEFDLDVSISISDEKTCPQFIARKITGLKNPESPEWLKKRLTAIGQKPISALVDITNYIAIDLGRPLHVYDVKKIKGNLQIRTAKPEEKFLALNNKEYRLTPEILVVADDVKPQAIAGVIGGSESGCDENTTEIILEVANFDPITVAKSGRALQINTDSRYRFERGIDKDFLENAAELATKMIADICGGKASKTGSFGTYKPAVKTINIPLEKFSAVSGSEISKNEIVTILTNLGFTVKETNNTFNIQVPSWRNDVSEEIDIVEEILRIRGFDKIPATKLPEFTTTKSLSKFNRTTKLRKLMAAKGYIETTNFSFLDSSTYSLFSDATKAIKIVNPISSDLYVLRSNLISSLLIAAKKNISRNYNNLNLFEIGPEFNEKHKDLQTTSLAAIRTGVLVGKNPHSPPRSADFFDMKADFINCCGLNPSSIQFNEETPAYYHPGKSAIALLGKTILGYIGDIHPQILSKMDIEVPVTAFELFTENLPESAKKAKSRFIENNIPFIERDFAFIFANSVKSEEIAKILRKLDKNLIDEVNIFDIYKGKGVEEGFKSIAFTIKIQPQEKSLTQEELEVLSAKITSELEKIGGKIRS